MKDEQKIRDGVRFVVQQVIERDGAIAPSVLVETARAKNSPAHDGFEWDDRAAGSEYRLIQARRWIRTTTVTVREIDGESEARTVHLVHIPSDEPGQREGLYKPITALIQSPDEYRRALDESRKLMAAARRSVDDLVELTQRTGGSDKIALISQLARGMEIMQDALLKM